MLGPSAMLGAAAGEAVGEAGSGPTGPPTNVSMFISSSELAIQWTNGDSSAFTQVGFNSDSGTDPTSVSFTANPGETSQETEGCICFWFVRHIKNSQTTAWVLGENCEATTPLCFE